jgi:hypothetical protein
MLSAFCLDKSIDYLENSNISNIRFLAKFEGNFFQNFFMFYLILGDVKIGGRREFNVELGRKGWLKGEVVTLWLCSGAVIEEKKLVGLA